MKNILIIGAGRSASALIRYLLKQALLYRWQVTVVDIDKKLAQSKIQDHPCGKADQLNVEDEEQRARLIQENDVIVSLLPAALHILVARDCLKLKKHLVTASYVSSEMHELNLKAKEASLIFMGEMGLDPGIDHMSAMKHIHQLQAEGSEINAFRSYTGGLVAPESDSNPWHYKFTWNPLNVVLAGQGTAQYLKDGRYKYVPYHRIFAEAEPVEVLGGGEYEVYANRDSLMYKEPYGIEDIPTLIRGTIRGKGFCAAWNGLVQLGLTDDSYPIVDSEHMTYRSFIRAFVDAHSEGTLEERVASMLNIDSDIMDKYRWLGLFEDKKINLVAASPARILLNLLIDKWQMEENDKDMILMQHDFRYRRDGEDFKLVSTLKLKGKDSTDTAMSRLVGFPLGILTKLIMLGKINTTGVNIPVMPDVYEPVLEELEELGVFFTTKEEKLVG